MTKDVRISADSTSADSEAQLETDVDKVLSEADSNGDGYIDFSEYRKLRSSKEQKDA